MTEKPYWCKNCGWSREEAEKRCSSACCKERREAEDPDRELPRLDYSRFRIFER